LQGKTIGQAVAFVCAFFRDIPTSRERNEVSTILRESLLAALLCHKRWAPLSAPAKKTLDTCASLRVSIAQSYPILLHIADEILYTAHGLRTSDMQMKS
jgi:hypothetical protein